LFCTSPNGELFFSVGIIKKKNVKKEKIISSVRHLINIHNASFGTENADGD